MKSVIGRIKAPIFLRAQQPILIKVSLGAQKHFLLETPKIAKIQNAKIVQDDIIFDRIDVDS